MVPRLSDRSSGPTNSRSTPGVDAIASTPGTIGEEQDSRPAATSATTTQPDRNAADNDHWQQTLYGTPYVVQMHGCRPPLSQIRPIVYNLSRGRVNIPEVTDGVVIRWWRSMLAKRVTKS